jgi:D-alanyl-D-alanine carboxypeptidase
LGSEDANAKFAETEKMIDYSYDNYTLTKVHDKGAIIETIEVDNATDETKSLNLLISDEITVMNNKKITVDKIIPEIKLNDEIKAPIVEGQELGTIKYKVDDIEYSAKLLAANNVEKKTYYVQIGIGVVAVLVCFLVFRRRPKRSKKNRNIY